jgi:hypothetical protein
VLFFAPLEFAPNRVVFFFLARFLSLFFRVCASERDGEHQTRGERVARTRSFSSKQQQQPE